MRLGVYTDYPYHRLSGQVYSERAFSVFVSRLASEPAVDSLTVIGRLDPTPARARYPLGAGTLASAIRWTAIPANGPHSSATTVRVSSGHGASSSRVDASVALIQPTA